MLLLLAGCAGKSGTRWYKEGSGQADFDRDVQECLILAEEFGRQATLGGRRPDLETQVKAYHQCLFAKGWSHIPPRASAEDGSVRLPEMTVVEQGAITVFGTRISLPEGFLQTGGTQTVQGPLVLENLSFRGPGPVFLNLVVQQSRTLPFEPIPYPVAEPFFLYDRGRMGENVQWSTFSGQVKGSWVAGLGAYLLVSPRERLTVVLTRTLPAQEDAPPGGLRLTEAQHEGMEHFLGHWLDWVEGMAVIAPAVRR
jgi:hypothetical protein